MLVNNIAIINRVDGVTLHKIKIKNRVAQASKSISR